MGLKDVVRSSYGEEKDFEVEGEPPTTNYIRIRKTNNGYKDAYWVENYLKRGYRNILVGNFLRTARIYEKEDDLSAVVDLMLDLVDKEDHKELLMEMISRIL
ncbi:hypothetical protein C9439_03020 [archaeon SCG-AAA382B04]|nr:hypothetical protein C9439_03020 [archaeon SCG-AAA382B04]